MAIVTQYHKDTDTTYVYESTSYWDPEKKQSRSKRKVIGKIDPESGEIIPTGRKGRPKREEDSTRAAAAERLAKLYDRALNDNSLLKSEILSLKDELAEAAEENRRLRSVLDCIRKAIGEV
ncbi:MAG: hypothetical protein IK007_04695 [Lachnospiraceae bacterium]|nr:hypothetical protein [Lachnospiraceae bacterium]